MGICWLEGLAGPRGPDWNFHILILPNFTPSPREYHFCIDSTQLSANFGKTLFNTSLPQLPPSHHPPIPSPSPFSSSLPLCPFYCICSLAVSIIITPFFLLLLLLSPHFLLFIKTLPPFLSIVPRSLSNLPLCPAIFISPI